MLTCMQSACHLGSEQSKGPEKIERDSKHSSCACVRHCGEVHWDSPAFSLFYPLLSKFLPPGLPKPPSSTLPSSLERKNAFQSCHGVVSTLCPLYTAGAGTGGGHLFLTSFLTISEKTQEAGQDLHSSLESCLSQTVLKRKRV